MPKFDSGSVEEYSPGMAAFTGRVLLLAGAGSGIKYAEQLPLVDRWKTLADNDQALISEHRSITAWFTRPLLIEYEEVTFCAR